MLINRMPRFLGFALACAAVLSFAACQKDAIETPTYTLSASELEDITSNTCCAIDPEEDYYFLGPNLGDAGDRASGLKNKFWTPGQTIRVLFLNGSTTLQNRVFAAAEQWEQYANINFVKVSAAPAEVRVAFESGGYWSYIGKDLVYVPANQKTMNLQFTDAISDSELRRITLHEFGHTLGLAHEQQQPASTIPWNVPAVYAYYAQTQGWSQQMVDQNVLNKATAESSQYTNFDGTSIMEYPVSASLTTNGYSIGWNTQLSATDKDFIGKMYSSNRIRVRHAVTNYTGNITFRLNGVHTTIKPNESVMVPVLTTSANALALYEQPTTNGAWVWDAAYAPVLGKNYKIVRVGTTNDFTLVQE